ncbi:MAG: N-acetylornithine carbamoyltransferase [Rhodothermales bacterium]|nr:N-acetylornithine carbamoyltransferase [Rhodothermales bacterium]
MMNSFISLSDFDRTEIKELLKSASTLERATPLDALRGKVLGLVFFNSSIRTLASFQSAMSKLGGSSFVVTPGQGSWNLEWRSDVVMDGDAAEHVNEAIPVLSSYADALGVRLFGGLQNITDTFGDRAFDAIRSTCQKPLINLESAVDHPCQALADWKTLDDYQIPEDGKFVLSWANHPRDLPLAVPAAAATMAAQRGMNVVVLRPDTHALPSSLVSRIQGIAASNGGSVVETDDRRSALDGASVLYGKSWGPTGQMLTAEKGERKETTYPGDWTIDSDWFMTADRRCKFMHCLPVRREVVVTSSVLDSQRSIVQRQAANRLYGQMAVLHAMLSKA